MNGVFTTSFFSPYSEVAKITYTEPDFNLVADSSWKPTVLNFDIYGTHKGSFTDLLLKYLKGYGKF